MYAIQMELSQGGFYNDLSDSEIAAAETRAEIWRKNHEEMYALKKRMAAYSADEIAEIERQAAENAAAERQRAYEHMMDNIQDVFADFWKDIYSREIDDFDDFADTILDKFESMAAQMTAEAMINWIFSSDGTVTAADGSTSTDDSSSSSSSSSSLLGSFASGLSSFSNVGSLFSAEAWTGASTVMGSLGTVVGVIGAAYTLYSIISGFLEDDPDPYIGIQGGEENAYRDFATNSDDWDFNVWTQDVDSSEYEQQFVDYFEDRFETIDEQLSFSLLDVINSTTFRVGDDDGSLGWIDLSAWEDDYEGLVEFIDQEIFSDLRTGLLDALGVDDIFDDDFFESITEEGQSIWDAFIGFATVVEDTDGFMDEITRQMEDYGESVEDAYENLVTLTKATDTVGETWDAIAKTELTSTLEDLDETWTALNETLEAANVTAEQLTDTTDTMNLVYGANLTTLSATTLQTALVDETDVEDTIESGMISALAAETADSIMTNYLNQLNEDIGAAYLDGGLEPALAVLTAYDFSGVQAEIEAFETYISETFPDAVEDATDSLEDITASGLEDVLESGDSIQNAIYDILIDSLVGAASDSLVDTYFSDLNADLDAAFQMYPDDLGAAVAAAIETLTSYDFSDAQNDIEGFQEAIISLVDTLTDSTDNFQTMLEGYVAWNQAMSDSYLPTGETVLEVAGLDSESFSNIAAGIDTLNAAVTGEEDGVVDFAASLTAFGVVFQELNQGLADGTITADQYSEVLGTAAELYADSKDAIEDTKDEFSDLVDTIQDIESSITVSGSDTGEETLASTQQAFADTVAAVLSGDTDAYGDLDSAAMDYLTALEDYSPTSYEYDKGQSYILRSLQAAEDYAEDQISETEELLIVAEDQVVILEGLSDTTTESLSALYSVDDTIQDLSDTISGMDIATDQNLTDLFGDYLSGESDLGTLLSGLEEAVNDAGAAIQDLEVTVTVETASTATTPSSTDDTTTDDSTSEEDILDLIGFTDYGAFWETATDGQEWNIFEDDGLENWENWYKTATDDEKQDYADKVTDGDVDQAMANLEEAMSAAGLPGYADGGVSTGPMSGYPVELHGTELIVPLDNPRNSRVSGRDTEVLLEELRAQDKKRTKEAKELYAIMNKLCFLLDAHLALSGQVVA